MTVQQSTARALETGRTLTYPLNNNNRSIMPIVHPPTRRSYILDSSTANIHALTFEVEWNVLAFDDVRNRESDCPVPYYQMHLGYVRMACHDQKFNHLREYANQLRLISLRDDIKSVRMLQCGKVSNKNGHGICHVHRLCPYCAVSWQ